ncbi:alanine dehydrogenase [Sinorhizobium terangae]|uniref:Ornithine cyclodeaminase n=1 Tax=Sinorhizobium terangae TaxID=110322 RepID=A0A6N7LBR3_SINTE|nr:ornithine cyclodeaminase [Sinorhizobium terangae]MBB4187296.1 alanine dehydrogenase [Sinorhizobium terangae]MQX14678.1 ornithine cyclodeaminase [Sinorhizobium terangae]
METTPKYISLAEMKRLGVRLEAPALHNAAKAAWSDIRSGRAHGLKSVLSFHETELWNQSHFEAYRNELQGERLGWKLSALSSVGARYAAVKVVGANAINRRLGLPRSTSTIVLLDNFTLRPLCIMDGTEISAARTATYASMVLELFFSKTDDLSVFLFGAGPIAEQIIKVLSHFGAGIISTIYVRSRSGISAYQLVERQGQSFGVRLEAVADNQKLRECRFVITASNASAPVFEIADICPNATILHLGGDETPADHIQNVLRSGLALCDDISMVSRRNSQSLALYFSRLGSTLEQAGPVLGVLSLKDFCDASSISERPILLTCVGLPMLDLYLAAQVYETWFLPDPPTASSLHSSSVA